MALTAWTGSRVRKADTTVAKNCLDTDEIDLLNRLTTGFLDFAELRARNRQQITMAEWAAQTDRSLAFNERGVLRGVGAVSRERMEAVVAERFATFDKQRRATETEAAEREAEADIAALIDVAKAGRNG